MTPVADLRGAGVSIWLDDLSRGLVEGGHLRDLVDRGIITGVTTNPTIFARAVRSEASVYRRQISGLAARGVHGDEAQRAVVLADVRAAADILLPVHKASGGSDGYVSVEVNPSIAHDSVATAAEASYVNWAVDRPNVMVKIPATTEGLVAAASAIGAGISVNLTLVFGPTRYREAIDAWLEGLEQAADRGADLTRIFCVASLFVSRVDTAVDRILDAMGDSGRLPLRAKALHGQAAISNTRLVWQAFRGLEQDPRWRALQSAGARIQRPVWASMGVKNPAYSPTRYVTELVGPHAVMTLPLPTLDAVMALPRVPRDSIGRTGSRELWNDLASLGITEDDITARLERDGLDDFAASWDDLTSAIDEAAARSVLPGPGDD